MSTYVVAHRPKNETESGRAGIEPATFGIKSPSERLATQRTEIACKQAVLDATNCNEMQPAETSPYSHWYSQLLLIKATYGTRL
jgi:hypothetical protein